MYKLLVLDMDGTLLDEHQRISDENCQAIKKATQAGIKIVIATGRTKSGIDPYLKQLDLFNDDDYCIVCSGAVVSTNSNGKIWSTTLTAEDFNYIYQLKKKLNLAINVYSEESILIEDNNYYSEFDALANNLPLEKVNFENLSSDVTLIKAMLINEDLSMAKDYNRIFPSMDIPIPDIAAKPHYNKSLFNDLSVFPEDFFQRFNVSKVTPYNIEISTKQANKRSGVEKLAERLNIQQDEIICVGDSGNDRQMIKYAGLGVAMGNAFPEIRAIADVVTTSNMNDGVAKVIYDYIL